ncbi:PepSY domain-containing protein [Neisseria perflava]|uniref:PepSY domain-containing protein n=1 Tax=Neisseria perflava TaxID=33053 RepID=UPI0020A14E34|nr:PepSY domain-containing protein [Neisseria perflava]MCP1660115.1 putative membrane protein YkoI [Neisseria perflava]
MKITGKIITSAAVLMTIAVASFNVHAASGADSSKIAALMGSKITAAQAVQAAQGSVNGQAAEVGFKHKNGQSYYEVEVLSGGKTHEIKVDAASGKILAQKTESESKAQAKTGVSLQQAIAAAEAKTGGRAKKTELKAKNGQTVYKVETVNAAKQKYEVAVNAANGSVISSQIDND